MVSSIHVEPVSRSDQYKRVMKPLLERKRRARINRCLDELRDLLVSVLQSEGEAVTRLEKADILELTVRHVRKLSQRRRLALPSPGAKQQEEREDVAQFQQGFVAAAQQVHSFLLNTQSLEPQVSTRLLSHLTSVASSINTTPAPVVSQNSVVSPPPVVANPAIPSQPMKAVGPPRMPQNSSPNTNSPMTANVSAQSVLPPIFPSGSQQFQKPAPPLPVVPRMSQPINPKPLPAYPVQPKREMPNPSQPLIDLSNHKSQPSMYLPCINRDVQMPDRKVAPSPFIDVVSTENDYPDTKVTIKSEFPPQPSPEAALSLHLQARFLANSAPKDISELHQSAQGLKRPLERCPSPSPQDLSMKKQKLDENGSSWRPW